MIAPEHLVAGSMAAALAGAIWSAIRARQERPAAGGAVLAIFACAALALCAASGAVGRAHGGAPVAVLGLRLHVDGLSALFLILIAFLSLSAALYSMGYLGESGRGSGSGRYFAHVSLFVAAMIGLVTITDTLWWFCIFWQLMTLPGYALIRFERDRPENARAARRYLLMMQLACAAAMTGAALLGPGPGGPHDLDTLRARLPDLIATRPTTVALALALFLLAFGIKMGMWPFGPLWLPDAHPAAPSPVSALLSGVMIKTGVYGMLRTFFWLPPADAALTLPLGAWGATLALLATATIVSGALGALRQNQSKRLLAFSSVGQVGYILLGIGVALALLDAQTRGVPQARSLAWIAFAGALWHVLNHGLLKGLLFLDAGSLLVATGTQDLDRMGGLMRRMPITGATTLLAALSLAGVPPLNGFASKWALIAPTLAAPHALWWLPACGLVAILASAVTLAVLVKFFGAAFLCRSDSRIRQREAAGKLRIDPRMDAVQLNLALVCLALGFLPGIGFGLANAALDGDPHALCSLLNGAGALARLPLGGIALSGSGAAIAPLAVALVLGLALLLARLLSRLGGSQRRAATPWLCGYASEHDCHRYLASGFYAELRRQLGRRPGRRRRPDPATPATADDAREGGRT